MKMAHYWQEQEQRWYDHYLRSEKLLDEVETALRKVEEIALANITDEAVRAEISKVVDGVWRGARS
jgi:hypothetical protein